LASIIISLVRSGFRCSLKVQSLTTADISLTQAVSGFIRLQPQYKTQLFVIIYVLFVPGTKVLAMPLDWEKRRCCQ